MDMSQKSIPTQAIYYEIDTIFIIKIASRYHRISAVSAAFKRLGLLPESIVDIENRASPESRESLSSNPKASF
jgi:hypothetical protein